jgi:hypothetical protein
MIGKLKNNKAPGEDSITGELITGGGRMLCRKMHKLMESVWKEEYRPEEWITAIICPIHKMGNKVECNSY